MGELRDALQELRAQHRLSYAALTKAAEAKREVLERSTLSDLFGRRCVMSESKLRTLLRALGVSDAEAAQWLEAWHRATNSGPRAGVKGFFSHLIADHTALFAGRDAETRQILDFIDRHAAGYVFVEALSGYGKTSLLANLVHRNLQFRYHFISQAYRRQGAGFDSTRRADVLDSLCEQLNPGHVRGGDQRSLEEEFIALLSRPYPKKTVVVIDGIDELGPGDKLAGLMQKRLPAGLVVVLSARTRGDGSYLPDAGLSPGDVGLWLTLPGLNTAEIVSLMEMAGGAADPLAPRPAVRPGAAHRVPG